MTNDQAALAKALVRIEELERVIFDLWECYKWDREEYHSNSSLVARAESALRAVRMRNHGSSDSSKGAK